MYLKPAPPLVRFVQNLEHASIQTILYTLLWYRTGTPPCDRRGAKPSLPTFCQDVIRQERNFEISKQSDLARNPNEERNGKQKHNRPGLPSLNGSCKIFGRQCPIKKHLARVATRSNSTTHQTRGIMPLNSAFGGVKSKSLGIAARTAFKP